MTVSLELARARFQWTLEVVAKEGIHLSYSWRRLFSEPIDVDWVMALVNSPEKAERMGVSSENLPAELSSLNHDDLPKTR